MRNHSQRFQINIFKFNWSWLPPCLIVIPRWGPLRIMHLQSRRGVQDMGGAQDMGWKGCFEWVLGLSFKSFQATWPQATLSWIPVSQGTCIDCESKKCHDVQSSDWCLQAPCSGHFLLVTHHVISQHLGHWTPKFQFMFKFVTTFCIGWLQMV